jgi:(p)ppGpp synthase/HD superfamily hydrolase
LLTFRYDHALTFASCLHRTQLRKGTKIPYVSHLIAVSSIVLEDGGDEDCAIGALLHDASEDQGGYSVLGVIRQMYGDDVAQIVHDCTDSWVEPKPAWRPRKEAYIASLDRKQDASLLVSLADKVHNVRAITSDYRELGEALWPRFTTGRETLWYYQALAEAFGRLRPCRLATEFEEAVTELVRISG